ncbi:Ig-like domain-containing protein [Thorsellia kenyensis]|uniref:Ig-like domain-containing protein n=1 Tax=Thorsellia kenyensis TaxID=1549888 RepID=A0ABV6C6Y8_9GAMM
MSLRNLNAIDMVNNNSDKILQIFNQGITNGNTPKLIGVGAPNDTVTVTSKDGRITYGQTLIDSHGNWSLEMPALKDSTYDLLITSKLFNDSTHQIKFTLTVDTKIPSTPTIDSVIENLGLPSGIVKNGGSTIDNRLEIRGSKAEKGATVLIYGNVRGYHSLIAEVVADNSGKWQVQEVILPVGTYDLTVTMLDKAGNESQPSKPYVVEVETGIQQPYGYPYIIQNINGKDHLFTGGLVEGKKFATKIAGNAPRDALIVEIFDNGALLGKASVINGSWTLNLPKGLLAGVHEISTIVKMRGNGSEDIMSSNIFHAVDNIVEAKVLYSEKEGTGSVIPVLNQGITNDNTPKLIGVGTPNATVTVTSKDGRIIYGQTVIDEEGNWSLEMPALKDATHDLLIKSSLQNENSIGLPYIPSNQSQFTFTVDTKIPPTPKIDSVIENLGLPSGIVKNGGSTIDNRLEIRGSKAEKGATVLIYGSVRGYHSLIAEVVADNSGKWQVQEVILPAGTYDLTVTMLDKAGNESQPSKPYVVEVETGIQQPYGYPYIIQNINGKDHLFTGGLVEGKKFATKIAGNAPRDALIVEIFDNGALLGKASVVNGSWTLNLPKGLLAGVHEISTIVKMRGNGSEDIMSGNTFHAVDNIVEAKVLYSEKGVTGSVIPVLNQGITNDNTPKLIGVGTPNATVTVTSKDGRIIYGQTVIDEEGNWSLQMPALKDATHDLLIKSSLQNENSISLPYIPSNQSQFTFTVDTKIPPTPKIDSVIENLGLPSGIVKNGGSTIDNRLEIRGSKAEKGATVLIYGNVRGYHSLIAEVVADNSGKWQVQEVILPAGTYDLTVTMLDKAGNESQPSRPYVVEVETGIQQPYGYPYIIQNINGKDHLFTGGLVEGKKFATKIAGNAPRDALIVEIFDNGALLGKASVVNGSWTLNLPKGLLAGVHEISTIVKMRGNGSEDIMSGNTFHAVDNIVEAKVLYSEKEGTGSVIPVLNQGITNDNTPKLIGVGTPNATVTVTSKDSRIIYGQTVIDEEGNWSLEMQALQDATYDLLIKSSLENDISMYLPYDSTNQSQFTLTVESTGQTITSFDNMIDEVLSLVVENNEKNADVDHVFASIHNNIQMNTGDHLKLDSGDEFDFYQLNQDDLLVDGSELEINKDELVNIAINDEVKILSDGVSLYSSIPLQSLASGLFNNELAMDL